MTASPDAAQGKEELLELYRIAVEEYRFNVDLTWDRIRFYVGLHMALVAVTSTLLRIESEARIPFLPIAVVGAVASFLRIHTIRKGHEYYRRSIYKRTLIAERLGFNQRLDEYPYELATLAVTPTESQAQSRDILLNTDKWLRRKLRGSTVTGGFVRLMKVFLIIYLFAGIWSILPLVDRLRPFLRPVS